MSIVLNVIYLVALVVSLPMIAWRRWRYGKNRRGWASKLWGTVSVPTKSSRRIWFHAVSVGEVNVLAPLIELIAQQHPQWDVVISTGTETGFDVARAKYSEARVFFCPWDFSWAVRRALATVQPDCLVLTELELWPNLIRSARSRGVRVAIVNGRLSDRSFRRYRTLRFFFAHLVEGFDLIAAQSASIAGRFVELGAIPERVHPVGNLKFDGALQRVMAAPGDDLPALYGIAADHFVLVAGSTQPEEDLMALEVFLTLGSQLPQLRLVLAPRHPHHVGTIVSELERHGVPYWRRSQAAAETATRDLPARAAQGTRPIVVVDVLGELASWWRRADVAYVGGSQGARGGQNMMEPAAFGHVVCFGPRTENFRDVVQLFQAADAVRVVHNANELRQLVLWTVENPEQAKQLGRRAQSVVQNNLGAAQSTLHLLESLLPTAAADAIESSGPAATPLSK